MNFVLYLNIDESVTDEVEDGIEDEDSEGDNSISENYMKTAITGRGVTLQMLITDGIIQPGNGLLTLKYLVKFLHLKLACTCTCYVYSDVRLKCI